jgi:hypothetical protein
MVIVAVAAVNMLVVVNMAVVGSSGYSSSRGRGHRDRAPAVVAQKCLEAEVPAAVAAV